jgi:Recombination endonuclease VII
MAQKTCRKCKISKNNCEFYSQPSNKDGLNWHCKICVKSRISKWQRKNKNKKTEYNRRWKNGNPDKAKDVQLRNVYGLSLEEFKTMEQDQKGLCLICQRERELVVDHCHKSSKVRGLLCRGCNGALGVFSDSPIILNRAIMYLDGSLI